MAGWRLLLSLRIWHVLSGRSGGHNGTGSRHLRAVHCSAVSSEVRAVGAGAPSRVLAHGVSGEQVVLFCTLPPQCGRPQTRGAPPRGERLRRGAEVRGAKSSCTEFGSFPPGGGDATPRAWPYIQRMICTGSNWRCSQVRSPLFPRVLFTAALQPR